MVSGMTSSPVAAVSQSVMMTFPSVVVQVNGVIVSTVRPFQSSPLSPKELRASIVTKATAPSATPENASATHGWCCSEESDARQAGAVAEGALPDAGDAIRDRDARQAGAVGEGIIPDAGNAIRDRDARQAAAAMEGILPDAGDAI